LASSSALAANALVIGGGAGAAPSTTTTGTGVVTALGVNTGTAGAFVVNGGALGTPSGGTVTNLTGTASININGTVGATTASTGAFTTLSATGTSTLAAVNASGEIRRSLSSDTVYSASTLNADHGLSVYNGSVTANSYASIEFINRASGTSQAGISSVTPSATNSALAFQVMTANVVSEPMRLSGTGLAVTGTLSATGLITATAGVVVGTGAGTYTAGSLGFSNANEGFLYRPPLAGLNTAHNFQSFGGTKLVGITEAGAVEITGTLSATGTLSGGTSGTAYSFSGSAPATSLTLNSSGNLGIGTSSPDCRLMLQTPSGTACQLNLAQSAVTNYRISIPASTDALTFVYGASTERMRLDSSGNLGIGTSSPTNKLDIELTTAGQTLRSDLVHTDNTNSASSAVQFISVGGASGGDPVLNFNISGVRNFGLGIDNSDSDKLKIYQDTTGAQDPGVGTLLTIQTDGNVGIGTSSPLNKLDVRAASDVIANYQTIQALSTDSAAINLGGGIGLGGYYSGTSSIAVFGNITGRKENGTGGNFDGYLAFGTNNTSTGVVERMRLDSSGNLLVGTTTANGTGITVQSSGNTIWTTSTSVSQSGLVVQNSATSGTRDLVAFQAGSGFGTGVGKITTDGTNTTYATSSDYRLKEAIQPMAGALERIAALKPCVYKWKSDGSDGEGFIAHELAEVCPHAVVGEKNAVNEDGSIKPQGIDTSFLVATLTAAIQEQQALITQLTARITALETA
jgi:hypothetical protein